MRSAWEQSISMNYPGNRLTLWFRIDKSCEVAFVLRTTYCRIHHYFQMHCTIRSVVGRSTVSDILITKSYLPNDAVKRQSKRHLAPNSLWLYSGYRFSIGLLFSDISICGYLEQSWSYSVRHIREVTLIDCSSSSTLDPWRHLKKQTSKAFRMQQIRNQWLK